MNRLILLTFLVFGFWACSNKSENISSQQTNQQSDIESIDSEYDAINIQFNNPTIIDSSEWVLYPLTLEEFEKTEKGFKKSSSSKYGGKGGLYAYWNIAFYNTETNQTQLLSDSLKMLISRIVPSGSIICYSITTTDFNQDGKLYYDDPSYLFTSDLSGAGFKQISPNDFDVVNWTKIKNKILIQTRRDSNNDKKFNFDDEIVLFVYDIEKQKTEPIFDQKFILKTKKLLESQWSKQK